MADLNKSLADYINAADFYIYDRKKQLKSKLKYDVTFNSFMNDPSSIVCYPISRRIFSIERIIVKVEHRDHKNPSYCPNPVDYYYSKAAPGKMSVAQWIDKRFNKCFPHLKATVVSLEINDPDISYQYKQVSQGIQLSEIKRKPELMSPSQKSEMPALRIYEEVEYENEAWMPRWCAYFVDLNITLSFSRDESNLERTQQAITEVQKELENYNLSNEIENQWKSIDVKIHLPRVVLTGAQCAQLENYFSELAEKHGGKSSFSWEVDEFLHEPFNAKNVGTAAEDLKQILEMVELLPRLT